MPKDTIRTERRPDCYLCGTSGTVLYERLRDRLFDAPGEWTLKRCPEPSCGLIWLDPMPLEEDIWKAYLTYYTHQEARAARQEASRSTAQPLKQLLGSAHQGYLANNYGYEKEALSRLQRLAGMLIYLRPGRRADIDFSVMYLAARPAGKLLDVGCGNGDMLELMKGRGWQTEGVDIDPKAVNIARAKGLKVYLGTLAEQGYPENSFDAVTLSHVIEHVHEPVELLRECFRILKPGGWLVVVTPNADSWGHLSFKESWLALDPPRHLHIFTLPALKKAAMLAGFSNYRASTTIRDAHNLFLASRSIAHRGNYVMGSPQPRLLQFWARGAQLMEWALLKIKPNAGEEIALIADK